MNKNEITSGHLSLILRLVDIEYSTIPAFVAETKLILAELNLRKAPVPHVVCDELIADRRESFRTYGPDIG